MLSSNDSPSHKHGSHGHPHHYHVHLDHDSNHEHNPDRFFVVPRGVIIEYGPYFFEGVCDFRVERLQGIQKMLEKVGARVKMIPCTDHLNRVQLWYMDNVIFTCKLTDLNHGGDGELDHICNTAARAFDHASRKAIHGLRHRFTIPDEELLEPFCPCINPHFFDQYLKDKDGVDADCEGPDCPIKVKENLSKVITTTTTTNNNKLGSKKKAKAKKGLMKKIN